MGKKKSLKKPTEDEDYVIYTETHRRRKACKKSITQGSWSARQNQIYLNFIKGHRQLFQTQFVRRSTKVFRKMSTLLRRRDPEQCRSHHQKLIIKSGGSLDEIINYLLQKIEKWKVKQNLRQSLHDKQKKIETEAKTGGDKDWLSTQTFQIRMKSANQINITISLGPIDVW